MDMELDKRKFLLDMKRQAVMRLEEAQEDLDAIDRVLQLYEKLQPPRVAASTEEIRLASIEVLKRHGEPVHRQVIFDELHALGVHINGKDPVASLGTVLSRCGKDFLSHGNGVWGLKHSKPTTPSHVVSLGVKGAEAYQANRTDDDDALPF